MGDLERGHPLLVVDAAGVVQTEGTRPTKYKLDREFVEHRIEVAEKQAEIAGE